MKLITVLFLSQVILNNLKINKDNFKRVVIWLTNPSCLIAPNVC